MKEYAGQKFGKLTAISEAPRRMHKRIEKNGKERFVWLRYYNCRCDCGQECIVSLPNLTAKKGGSKSCGCKRRDGKSNPSYLKALAKRQAMVGKKFGGVTVIGLTDHSQKVLVHCEICGREREVRVHRLEDGRKSCGCRRGRAKHGMSWTPERKRTPTYMSWIAMNGRVNNPNSRHSLHGIVAICERWKKFENFLEDMGLREPGKFLGRIDYEKDYSPENCAWMTREEIMKQKKAERQRLLPKIRERLFARLDAAEQSEHMR